jgi:hypothetical protein
MPDRLSSAAMPDPMAKWTPVPDWRTVSIVRGDWSARPILGYSMVLVAGDMSAALGALAGETVGLGYLATAEREDAYAIRIARDRALLVSIEPILAAFGWQAGGWSATPAESAYGIIEIGGEALDTILAEATAVDVGSNRRSAAVLFAGITCLVVRMPTGAARLHAEIGHLPYLWRWLETRA